MESEATAREILFSELKVGGRVTVCGKRGKVVKKTPVLILIEVAGESDIFYIAKHKIYFN